MFLQFLEEEEKKLVKKNNLFFERKHLKSRFGAIRRPGFESRS